MGDSSFTLSDGLVIHTPLILLNKQVILWDAPNLKPTAEKPIMPNGLGWEEWSEDLWKIFEVVSPRPGEKRTLMR
jgi:NADH dehydrogenase [ubiquinone] 1 alpha subcomplex assembly factor 3